MASYQDLSQHLSLQYSHGEGLAVCIPQAIKTGDIEGLGTRLGKAW